MPNTEALWTTLLHIEANPETWDQRHWICGTSYCFAGHAVVTVLGAAIGEPERITLTREQAALLNRWEVDESPGVCPWSEGDAAHVADFARDALGLTQRQADNLFCPMNTLSRLRRMVEEITGESRPPVHVPRETSAVGK